MIRISLLCDYTIEFYYDKRWNIDNDMLLLEIYSNKALLNLYSKTLFLRIEKSFHSISRLSLFN